MDTIIIALQVVLAGILLVSSVAKLKDLNGSRKAVQDFGVPALLARPLGLALPVGELALAPLLLFESTARWAALGALGLFLVFIAAIAYNLYLGKQPDCHCFGQLHSAPAGWSTIFRNIALAAAAVVVVGQGGRSIPEWLSHLSDVGQLALVLGGFMIGLGVVHTWLMRDLVRQTRKLVARLENMSLAAPSAGEHPTVDKATHPAAEFNIPDVNGGRLTLQGMLDRGKPVLLLFTDPGCGPCNALLPDLGEWNRRFSSELTIAIISVGSVDDNRAKTSAHGLLFVGLHEWPDVSKPYGVIATPTGVLVDTDGIIRKPNAIGRNEIRELVTRTLDNRPEPTPVHHDGPVEYNADGSIAESVFPDPSRALRLGMSVPRLPLPDLEGNYISIDDFRGERLLLLFWNTDCSFCNRMLPDLKDWEQQPGSNSPKLIVATAGATDAVRELGLQSTVLLDDGLAAISKAFGAPGTPSAVLIDEQALIASEIMIGADAILDFLDEQDNPVDEGITVAADRC